MNDTATKIEAVIAERYRCMSPGPTHENLLFDV